MCVGLRSSNFEMAKEAREAIATDAQVRISAGSEMHRRSKLIVDQLDPGIRRTNQRDPPGG